MASTKTSASVGSRIGYIALCSGLGLLVLALAAVLVGLIVGISTGAFDRLGPRTATVVTKTALPEEFSVGVEDGYVWEQGTDASWLVTFTWSDEPGAAVFSKAVDESTYEKLEVKQDVCIHRGELIEETACEAN